MKNTALIEIMNARFDAMDARFDKTDQKIDTLFEAFDDVRKQVASIPKIEKRVASVENENHLERTLLLENSQKLREHDKFVKNIKKAVTT